MPQTLEIEKYIKMKSVIVSIDFGSTLLMREKIHVPMRGRNLMASPR